MDAIVTLCDRVWVLAEGNNLVDGTPTKIQNDPRAIEAYLGIDRSELGAGSGEIQKL